MKRSMASRLKAFARASSISESKIMLHSELEAAAMLHDFGGRAAAAAASHQNHNDVTDGELATIDLRSSTHTAVRTETWHARKRLKKADGKPVNAAVTISSEAEALLLSCGPLPITESNLQVGSSHEPIWSLQMQTMDRHVL